MSPYFDTLAAALSMDGHGAYVWPAYLIATMALASIVILPRIKERKVIARIAGELKRQQNKLDSEVGKK